jgi:hypothetical protein
VTVLTATPSLRVADLLQDPETVHTLLGRALGDEQWLDAYLLAAGLTQVVEDLLHPDPLQLRRAAAALRGPLSRLASGAAAVAGLRIGPARGRLTRARHELAALTGWLADRVLERPGQAEPPPGPDTLTGLATEIIRVPACFRSFDLYPDDVVALAGGYLAAYPEPGTPVCVVGVRTSGSYLAPLLATALRGAGVRTVDQLTSRPGRPWLRSERARIAGIVRAGGRVLIIDDPPGTGTSFAATAHSVERVGVPPERVVLLVPLFAGDDEPPPALRRWPAVPHRWADWSVRRRLRAEPVRLRLAELVEPELSVLDVAVRTPPAPTELRGHATACFTVRFRDPGAAREFSRDVVVEGAGLGYLGRQAEVVAGALPEHLPEIYGFADGLLYRDSPSGPPGAPAATIAGYVATRARRLPANGSPEARMRGRDPVWEVAAMLLSGQFGRLALLARPLLLEPLTTRLLAGHRRCVVDGHTDHRRWRYDAAAGGPHKADFFQRTFSHLELTCYDPAFDLAGAAADPPEPGFETALRAAYLAATGEQVDGERWLLYRLSHLWRMGRAGDLDAARVRRSAAAAVHDYLAERYLRDLPAASGPLCAIDLDGVLECDPLGYPVTSPTGALALRGLIAHGYRPVPVTGRSVADVRDRCVAFGLAGGVAEYGTALHTAGGTIDLRPTGARVLLGAVREQLACCPGVRLDPEYSHTVRGRTRAGPLPPELLARIPALSHPLMRVIHGAGQTDVTVRGITKATGLRALATRLSTSDCALAVGDSPEDVPMLAAASLARAPRNARLTGVRRTRHSYQLGLADACADLLGHHPGGCPTCRPPVFPLRTLALLTVLDLRANGLASLPTGTAALALTIASRRW